MLLSTYSPLGHLRSMSVPVTVPVRRDIPQLAWNLHVLLSS
jgi:hypothetical protein